MVAGNGREEMDQESIVKFLNTIEGLLEISDYKFREEPIFIRMFFNNLRMLGCQQRREDF